MTKRIAVIGSMAVTMAVGVMSVAAADEPRPQPAAPMILNLLNRPLESPEAAFNKQLKNDIGAPAAKRNDDPEVLPDGSVRYGTGAKSVTVTIKNPCPPGDIEHEIAAMRAARQLPGRAVR